MKRSLTIIFGFLIVFWCSGIVHGQSANDAYKALRKLQARTETGVSYRDYPKVLADAKFEVDSFLENKEAKKYPQLAEYINKALNYYLLAGNIWELQFSSEHKNGIIFLNSPEAKSINKMYPKAKAELKITPGTDSAHERIMREMGPSYYIPVILNDIWGDASKEIKKASEYLKTD